MSRISVEDCALSFGITGHGFTEVEKKNIQKVNLDYQILQGSDREQCILEILKSLDLDLHPKVGREKKTKWQEGWSENLQAFIQSEYDLETLVPKFIRPNKPLRIKREFATSTNPHFELDYFRIFRRWLFRSFFDEAKTVFEFGCGTGFNLVELAGLYPNKSLVGLDWVDPSLKLVELISKIHHFSIQGRHFDFFSPDPSLDVPPQSLFFTVCALEQIGCEYEPFIQFVLRKCPLWCINMEPLLELYDKDNLVDYLAIRFHIQRGYLNGFLSRLRQLEQEGRVEIKKVQRLFFGSLFHDAYSYVIWRPVRQ